MDDELKTARELLEGRFSSPFDLPEGAAGAREHAGPRRGQGHRAERLEFLRCDPFEHDEPHADPGSD